MHPPDALVKEICNQIRKQYGGGCINDVIIHLATSEMGFGGVGESGMGSYHGKDGFAHAVSAVQSGNIRDIATHVFKINIFRKRIYKWKRQK